MKNNWALSLSAILYIILGIIFLIVLPIKNSPPNGTVIGVAIFLAAFCFYLGYAALRARTGTFIQKRNFGIVASIFCGGVAGISGLIAGIVLGIPLAIGLLGIREIWWRGSEG